MSTAMTVSPFDRIQLPARLQQVSDAAIEANNDLLSGGGASFPALSFKGKVWHIVQGDDRTLIAHPDTGDPLSSIEVVLVKANKGKSKVFYANGYVEGSADKPDCFSNDGIAPDPSAKNPQAKQCDGCPANAWGSRIADNGNKGKACSDSKRLAVAAPSEIDNPMLLRVPAATLKDLTAYALLLSKRNVPYDEVVTKIGFDHTVAHPQLKFSFVRFLTDDEAAAVKEIAVSEKVGYITGTVAMPTREADDGGFSTAQAPARIAAPAPATKAAAKSAPVVTEEDVAAAVAAAAVTKASAPAPAAAAAAPKTATKKVSAFAAASAAVAEEKAAAPKAAPAVVATVADPALGAALDGLLDALDD